MASLNIEAAYINAFKAGFTQAFQQTNSRLRPHVEIESQAAEFDYYDRVGLADDMNPVTTRYGANPINNIPHDRRQIGLKDWDFGKPVDEKDLIRVATDPTSAYMQAALASANRKIDDIIIQGFTNTAYTGKAGGTSVTFAAATANKVTLGAVSNQAGNFATDSRYTVTAGNVEGIWVDSGFTGAATDYIGTRAASSGLNLAKLKVIRETMLGLEAIEQDQEITMVIGRRQFNDLLGIEEIINGDFTTKRALEAGHATSALGFRFIHSERLPTNSVNSQNVRTCFAFLPKAFKLSIGKDLTADMWRLTGNKNIPYAYVKLSMGGSRMWGEVLAVCACVES